MMKMIIAITTQAATKVLVETESSPTGYLIERSEQKNPRRNGAKNFFLNNTNNMIKTMKLEIFNTIDVNCELILRNIDEEFISLCSLLSNLFKSLFLISFMSVELFFELLKLLELPFIMMCCSLSISE